IIHDMGNKVSGFEIGDEVIINPGMNWGNNENYQSRDFKILGMPDNGTLAEFVKVHHNCIYKSPSHLNFEQSSVLPLAGVTAFRSLFKKAEINKNDNVLITGIGGGVASLALMFAVNSAAKVFVTSGDDRKLQKAISLGAIAGVNYKNNEWDKKLIGLSENKINVVIDGTGGESYLKYFYILNYGGRIVSYGATSGSVPKFNLHRIFWKQIKLSGSTMGSPNDFAEMMEFISKKKAEPVIDEVFSLENICDAFRKLNSGSQFGKIVVAL
ncbi:MAG: zinc-binding dehydrogenase, partial [Bacteroidota bacterium]|nr:zinc-binding dehydrogenase [Bacteroidota bacterium]